MEEKELVAKTLLLGKYIIINDGDFKGVSGLVKSLNIENSNINVTGGRERKKIMSFVTEVYITCQIIVNEENTIKVPLEFISKLD